MVEHECRRELTGDCRSEEHADPDPRRADWSATYYHRADAGGIGFDRTPSGSNYVAQYRSPLRERWASPATTPENLLLWFHRVQWDYKLSNGRTLWQGLVDHYTRGAAAARSSSGSLWRSAGWRHRTSVAARRRCGHSSRRSSTSSSPGGTCLRAAA